MFGALSATLMGLIYRRFGISTTWSSPSTVVFLLRSFYPLTFAHLLAANKSVPYTKNSFSVFFPTPKPIIVTNVSNVRQVGDSLLHQCSVNGIILALLLDDMSDLHGSALSDRWERIFCVTPERNSRILSPRLVLVRPFCGFLIAARKDDL